MTRTLINLMLMLAYTVYAVLVWAGVYDPGALWMGSALALLALHSLKDFLAVVTEEPA